jgi:hypothetical protein
MEGPEAASQNQEACREKIKEKRPEENLMRDFLPAR